METLWSPGWKEQYGNGLTLLSFILYISMDVLCIPCLCSLLGPVLLTQPDSSESVSYHLPGGTVAGLGRMEYRSSCWWPPLLPSCLQRYLRPAVSEAFLSVSQENQLVSWHLPLQASGFSFFIPLSQTPIVHLLSSPQNVVYLSQLPSFSLPFYVLVV